MKRLLLIALLLAPCIILGMQTRPQLTDEEIITKWRHLESEIEQEKSRPNMMCPEVDTLKDLYNQADDLAFLYMQQKWAQTQDRYPNLPSCPLLRDTVKIRVKNDYLAVTASGLSQGYFMQQHFASRFEVYEDAEGKSKLSRLDITPGQPHPTNLSGAAVAVGLTAGIYFGAVGILFSIFRMKEGSQK